MPDFSPIGTILTKPLTILFAIMYGSIILGSLTGVFIGLNFAKKSVPIIP